MNNTNLLDSFSRDKSSLSIYIGGESEKINKNTLEYLIQLDLDCYYFINPSSDLLDFLRVALTEEKYAQIKGISTSEVHNLSTARIIVSGIQLLSNDFEQIKKKCKGNVIFFSEKLGLFLNSLQRSYKNIDFVESTINEYLPQFLKPQLINEPSINTSKSAYFVNRGKEIDLHSKFLINEHKYGCKIIGIPGIGKRSFLTKLRTDFGLNKLYFEISFHDRYVSLHEILFELLEKFQIKYSEEALKKIKLPHHRTPKILVEALSRFDSLENATLVFSNIEEIFDTTHNRFYKKEIELFFSVLLNRKPSRFKNKIYFISSMDFKFKIEDENLIQTIYLKPFDAKNIKLIISQAFSENNYNEYAVAIRNIDNDVINATIAGHPQIAKIFVYAAQDLGMGLLDDPFLKRSFEKEKINYLLSKIPLSAEELDILGQLALFKKYFTIDYIKKHLSDIDTLRNLIRKFFVETIYYSRKDSRYHVPELIKSYVLNRIDEEKLRQNHSKIGKYYWNLAEGLNANNYESFQNYLSALLHFKEADEIEKYESLIQRFSPRLLEIANENYKKGEIEEAYKYYQELSKHNRLDVVATNHFLRCSSILNKNDTKQLFEEAVKNYPKYINIFNSYLKFLFDQEDYLKAKELYDSYPHRSMFTVITENIHARILSKLGFQEEASKHFESRLALFEKTKAPSNSERVQYIRDCMQYYGILDHHKLFIQIQRNLISKLEKSGISKDYIQSKIDQPFDATKARQLDLLFSRALEHKKADRILATNYINFLIKQGHLDKAQKIEEQKNNYLKRYSSSKSNNKKKYNKPKYSLHATTHHDLTYLQPSKIDISQISSEKMEADALSYMQVFHQSNKIIDKILGISPNDLQAIDAKIILLTDNNTYQHLQAIIDELKALSTVPPNNRTEDNTFLDDTKRIIANQDKLFKQLDQLKGDLNKQYQYITNHIPNKHEMETIIKGLHQDSVQKLVTWLEQAFASKEIRDLENFIELEGIFQDLKESSNWETKIKLAVPLINYIGINIESEIQYDLRSHINKIKEKTIGFLINKGIFF